MTLTTFPYDAHLTSQEVYHASVEEHSPAGTELVRVNATDEDSGMYGEVSYAIPGEYRG